MWYGAAYYPEHRNRARWDYDLDNMVAAHINALRVGEFAWKRFEPRPGEYDFSWLDDFLARAQARGIKLVICPPWRTAPAWLLEEDPSVQIVLENGYQLEYGSRYTFCINHPLLLEKGAALAEALAAHYADNPAVIAWHLDNEHGDEPDCHCANCREKWQHWLHRRFGDIAALNRAWGMVFWGLEFDHFGQVPTPMISKTYHNPGLLLAWRQFRSECTVAGIAMQAEAVRRHARQPITTNFQALWNPRTDYYAAAAHLDQCGTNYYPPYGANYRSAALGLANVRGYRKQNFLVHELRNGPHIIAGRGENTPAPGEVERLVVHTVANGADGLFFFRFRACPFGAEQHHGSLTGYDGQRLRAFAECSRAGARLQRLAPLLAGTEVVSEVALIYDFPTRWYLETGGAWQPDKRFYLNLCKSLYAGLCAQAINVDSVGRQGDFAAYKVLVVPCLTAFGDELAEKLYAYVEQGGMLVWHPLGGLVNEHAAVYPDRLHPRLVELFGLRPLDVATGSDREVVTLRRHGRDYECRHFFELSEVTTGTATAHYTSSWFGGYPAVVERRVGVGRTVYLGTYPDAAFYQALYAELLPAAGVQRLLPGDVPEGVEVTERRAKDGRRLLFLLNGSGDTQVIDVAGSYHDVWHEEAIDDKATLAPFGVRVLVRR
jgi:beta-galactosidase